VLLVQTKSEEVKVVLLVLVEVLVVVVTSEEEDIGHVETTLLRLELEVETFQIIMFQVLVPEEEVVEAEAEVEEDEVVIKDLMFQENLRRRLFTSQICLSLLKMMPLLICSKI